MTLIVTITSCNWSRTWSLSTESAPRGLIIRSKPSDCVFGFPRQVFYRRTSESSENPLRSINVGFKLSTAMNNSLNSTASSAILPRKFVSEPFAMTVVRLSLFGIMFLAAVIGNFFVFTALFGNSRLRTFSYYLITNLAISDFFSILWVPLILVDEQLKSGWIYGPFLCKLMNPSQVVCGLVTTNVHVAIAADRYFSIVSPFGYSCNHFKYRRAFLVVSAIWIVAVVCSLPLFIFRRVLSVTFKSGRKMDYCFEIFPPMNADSEHGYRQIYSVFLFLVNYIIPLSISTVLYAKIILHLKKTKLERKKLGRKFSQRSKASTNGTKVYCNASTQLERRFISMAIVIILIFFFCYLPYQVVFLLVEFTDYAASWKYVRILTNIVYFLTWVPNALNPICFGAMDQRYSKAFRKICFAFQDTSDKDSKTNQSGSLSRQARKVTDTDV